MADTQPVFQAWQAPDWTKKPIEECLEQVRCYVEERLEGEIGWYQRGTRRTRGASRVLRAFAIVLTGLGTLAPILESAGAFEVFKQSMGAKSPLRSFEFSQLGYVLLAMAGGFALFDRFFGFSTAWMRYVAAMIALEKLRESFRADWMVLGRRVSSNEAEAIAGRLLDLAKRTILKAKDLTERETEAWIGEFKSSLSTLEKDLRNQTEAGRPGAIEVRVKDFAKAPTGVELRLDHMLVESATGPSIGVGNVPPGLHKVTITAAVNGRSYAASQMINVSSAEVAQLELELGIA